METAKELIKRVEKVFTKASFKAGESYNDVHDRLMSESIDEYAKLFAIEVLKECLDALANKKIAAIENKIIELENQLPNGR